MLKITVTVKDNEKSDSCTVKTNGPKDFTKATENEKRCCSIVLNEINNTIKNLNGGE